MLSHCSLDTDVIDFIEFIKNLFNFTKATVDMI